MLALSVLFEREHFSEHIGVAGLAPCMKNLTASHDEPDTWLSTEKTANCEDHGFPLALGDGLMRVRPAFGQTYIIGPQTE